MMQTRSITSNFNSIQRNILSYLLQEINNNNCTVLTGSRQERVYNAYNVFNFIIYYPIKNFLCLVEMSNNHNHKILKYHILYA